MNWQRVLDTLRAAQDACMLLLLLFSMGFLVWAVAAGSGR